MKLFGFYIKLLLIFIIFSFTIIKANSSNNIPDKYLDGEEEEDDEDNFEDDLDDEIDNDDNADEDDFLEEDHSN